MTIYQLGRAASRPGRQSPTPTYPRLPPPSWAESRAVRGRPSASKRRAYSPSRTGEAPARPASRWSWLREHETSASETTRTRRLQRFLSSLREPQLVLVTIAVSLNVREQPGQSALEALSSHLQGKRLLLVLDNLEHLPESFRELAELLSACPGLTLLCTSRERLRLQGERVYELPPLSEDGVRLPLLRAGAVRARRPNPRALPEARRAPLAIELAAARTSVLTPRADLDPALATARLLEGRPRP